LQPFPSFHTLRNDLELEEIELDHSVAQGQTTAFYSTPSGGGRPPQQLLPPCPPPQELACPQVAPPPPRAPNPNNGGKGKGKDKGKGKGKNIGFGNNSKGAPAWPSFYNPWTDTISMWSGMHPPQQQLTRPPQHTLLAAPTYYGTPDGPSFMSLPVPPPHQQQAVAPAWSS
jgi:hypothetical protein